MCSVIVYCLHCICVCDCDSRHKSLIMLSPSVVVRRSHLLARCYLGTMCMCTTEAKTTIDVEIIFFKFSLAMVEITVFMGKNNLSLSELGSSHVCFVCTKMIASFTFSPSSILSSIMVQLFSPGKNNYTI
jgi:hypothetical protein